MLYFVGLDAYRDYELCELVNIIESEGVLLSDIRKGLAFGLIGISAIFATNNFFSFVLCEPSSLQNWYY